MFLWFKRVSNNIFRVLKEYYIFGLGNGGQPNLKHLKKCSVLVQLVFQHDIKSCSLFGI